MNQIKGPAKIYRQFTPNHMNAERTVIDSELLRGVQYEIKDGHIIIFGRENGTLAINFKSMETLITELTEIKEVYAV